MSNDLDPRKQRSRAGVNPDDPKVWASPLLGTFERLERAGWRFDDIERAVRKLLEDERQTIKASASLEADLAIMRAMAKAAR